MKDALKATEHLVKGFPLTLYTDHKNNLLNDSLKANQRFQKKLLRWSLELEELTAFDFSYILRAPKLTARITAYHTSITNASEISFFFAEGIGNTPQEAPQGEALTWRPRPKEPPAALAERQAFAPSAAPSGADGHDLWWGHTRGKRR